MQTINILTEEEKLILINEFIVTDVLQAPGQSANQISIEFLKFLRGKRLKIENISLFNELCSAIEKKYYK